MMMLATPVEVGAAGEGYKGIERGQTGDGEMEEAKYGETKTRLRE
jgi:hypothetical protein